MTPRPPSVVVRIPNDADDSAIKAKVLRARLSAGVLPVQQIPHVSICNRCGVPTVDTFAFDKCENYCLECGGRFGMFGYGHHGVKATVALLDERDRRAAEFAEHAGDVIPQHQWRSRSEDDLVKHRVALDWLIRRATVNDGGAR